MPRQKQQKILKRIAPRKIKDEIKRFLLMLPENRRRPGDVRSKMKDKGIEPPSISVVQKYYYEIMRNELWPEDVRKDLDNFEKESEMEHAVSIADAALGEKFKEVNINGTLNISEVVDILKDYITIKDVRDKIGKEKFDAMLDLMKQHN